VETWIQEVLNSESTKIITIAAVFFLGIASVFLCACNISVIGILTAYTGTIGTSGKTNKIIFSTSLFFLLGMLVSMTAIGGIIGFASEYINITMGVYWKVFAGLIAIFFGAFTLDLIPFKIPGFNLANQTLPKGIFSSFIFGLTIGGLSLACSSCCNPVFPLVMAVTFVKGSILWGILLLFSYALGYGLTLACITLLVSLGLGKMSNTFRNFGTYLKYVAGIIMLIIGFYLLLTL